MNFDVTSMSADLRKFDNLKSRSSVRHFSAASMALEHSAGTSAILGLTDARSSGSILGAARGAEGLALVDGLGGARANVKALGTIGIGSNLESLVSGARSLGSNFEPLRSGLLALASVPKNSVMDKSTLMGTLYISASREGLFPRIENTKLGTIASFFARGFEVDRKLSLQSPQDIAGMGKLGLGGIWSRPARVYGASSVGASSAAISGFGVDPVLSPWSGVQKLFNNLARAGDLLAPYLKQWDRLAKDLTDWAAREAAKSTPEDQLAAAAFDALESLEDNRHWETDRFLKRHLNLRPSPQMKPYVYQALWMLLRADIVRPYDSPAKWRTLELRAATAYLSTSIYNEARRLKRDIEMEDRLWWGQNMEPPLLKREVLLDGSSADPADEVMCLLDVTPPDDRVLTLESLSLNGTGGDQEIVRLVRNGEHDRASIRNEVGSPKLQAFERKSRRWRADESY